MPVVPNHRNQPVFRGDTASRHRGEPTRAELERMMEQAPSSRPEGRMGDMQDPVLDDEEYENYITGVADEAFTESMMQPGEYPSWNHSRIR